MTLTINGRNDSLDAKSLSVIELLKLKAVEMPEMVSVQLNGDILERSEFESTQVSDGDEVEFLYFMGGGSGRLTPGGPGRSAPNGAGANGASW